MATERERSAGELVQGIISDIQRLLRDEIALARAEITEVANEARASAPKLVGGSGALATGGLLLVLALAEAVSTILGNRRWAGYGLVGLLLAGLGAVLLQQLRGTKLVPDQTIQTMQDNATWLKNKVE